MPQVHINALSVSGPHVRTNNALEATSARKIPGLWAAFGQAQAASGAGPGAVYAVYSDYQSDANGEYTLTLGEQCVPAASGAVSVQAGDYLTFAANGARPAAIIDAWKAVWAYFSAADRSVQRAYQTDFEKYESPTSATIYIGVKSASAA